VRSVIRLQNEPDAPLPPELLDSGTDVRYPAALVEHFLAAYTRPGDLVLDPFAGFGTTLRVAEAMDRPARGIERDAARVAHARSLLRDPTAMIRGDTRELAGLSLPPIDFSITSPPYMRRDDATDPLAGYVRPGRGYRAYLADLRAIYQQIGALMTARAHAVVEIANLKDAAGVTTLAWDAAATIAAVLPFLGEVVVDWTPSYGYGYDHSYCLVFGAPTTRLDP
jgi:tRNA G10  N-methylase Trm11